VKKIFLLPLLFLFYQVNAQDPSVKKLQEESGKEIKKDPNDTLPWTWKTGGLYSLNVAQSSLSNWAGGGEEFSISLTSLLSLYAFHKKNRFTWDNTFDFALGYVNTTSLGSRKSDDRFDLLSKAGHRISPKVSLSGIFNVRSQFFNGYTYDENVPIYSSTFMAPGYLLLGAGFDYKPNPNLSVFFSPATARWVFVWDTLLSNKGMYGVKPGDKSIFEFGAFLSVNYLKAIGKNIVYKGRLDLYSNYLIDPQNIDLYMTNLLSVKLGKWLALNYGLDLIYDDDVELFGPNKNAPRLQVKSLVGLGFQVRFNNN
jgi:Protein of unknown function (DUF3078)